MLSHESLMSYYKYNNLLLFKKKGDFDQNMTLTELEEMLPYERMIYTILIEQRIEQHNQDKGNR